MKVLYVDQLAKTSGCYSLPQAEYIYHNEGIEIKEYISDNIDFSLDKYNVPIVQGFHNVYSGNAINKAINYMKSLSEVKEYITKNSIDILHLQWFLLPWIEWTFVKEMRKYCKIVITIHDVIPFNCRPFEMKALDRIYSYADYLLLHSDYAEKMFIENYKTRRNTAIITQGFCSKANYKRVEKQTARNYFNIPKDSTVILYYGTIRQSKGLDILLKAFYKAFQKNNKVFLLAGGAFQKVNESEYRELTEKCVTKQNSRVSYGFVPSQEEALYFSAADIICLPYRKITQSGVAQNALMYELPIIATDIGAMNEVVRPGFNGELFPVDNTAQLTDIIVKLAENDDLVRTYSEGAKYLSENEFSLENKSRIVADIYRKLSKE